ncbi:hypothetical protein [Methylobacterium longum]|uniref:Integrase n=1 Tax=Methylobacterium longum TaxID=767694 RepID=A0ABT8AR64_9HYPH|nr:hypothetical protein [Methylobacterium longum]MDN3572362.1 hypothetical protein [Methylobacterium longum]GJE09494.1 hypothetical protein FOHLNKBM_0518 [Methylobacterium longum]
MYGFQLLRLCEEMKSLGLVSSREQFSRSWCGRGSGYLHDYTRRDGATARVSSRTIERLRLRLAEAGALLPEDLRDRVRAYDEAIIRDLYISDLLSRRSIDARCP